MQPNDVVAAGRVAVVTGAASGIGFALSERFAAEGMRVVMADVEAPALAEAADLLAGRGAEVLPVTTDVSSGEQVEALRDRALAAFGAVHLVCNNAGVTGMGRPLWEMSRQDWDWVLGVNLWGVINGIRAFVPALLEQDAAHVVNTASMAGLTAGILGPYSVTKHGVVALSEALHFQLQQRGAAVRVSVLCPGWVRTRILEADRNRPAELAPPPDADPAQDAARDFVRQLVETGMDPADVAGHVVDAVRSGRFYVLTHPEMGDSVRRRAEEVLAGGPPGLAFL
ncbi:MAG TPA: SDR family NAD(P)-dependent oxidoreductase [Candidatus Dormibacteraeota bacterium]|nr:SDR family NAD(P)-dependent oxidoreductase [Candidatus Dormibacteraeota bacterium]